MWQLVDILPLSNKLVHLFVPLPLHSLLCLYFSAGGLILWNGCFQLIRHTNSIYKDIYTCVNLIVSVCKIFLKYIIIKWSTFSVAICIGLHCTLLRNRRNATYDRLPFSICENQYVRSITEHS